MPRISGSNTLKYLKMPFLKRSGFLIYLIQNSSQILIQVP